VSAATVVAEQTGRTSFTTVCGQSVELGKLQAVSVASGTRPGSGKRQDEALFSPFCGVMTHEE
jgi:hypothetical protein